LLNTLSAHCREHASVLGMRNRGDALPDTAH
jgi:hypothetical protein